MEAHDGDKTKENMMNFSGSAGDMLAAMQAAGINVPDAAEAAKKAAAAAPSAPEACDDPSCTHDHSHGGHSHSHRKESHGHSHDEHAAEPAACEHHREGRGHDHDHGHDHQHTTAPPAPPSAAEEAEKQKSKEEGGVECVDATDSSLTLAWTPIPKCIKYELEWRPAGVGGEEGGKEAEWAKLGSKGFKTALPPKQKNKLAPDATFEFRVRGRDEVDWFPWSPVRRHATLAPRTKRLPAVALSKAEEGALTVTWTKPAEGDDVGTYELQIREAKEAAWTTVSTSLKGTAARKRNLDPEGRYTFRVRPVMREGEEGAPFAPGEWYFSPPNAPEFKPTPPTHPLFAELFGPTLLLPGKQERSTCGLDRLAGKVVGVYFSASWCGPCRQFTPMLAQIHAQARAAGRQFEVVFVSADRDTASFNDYFRGHQMPWLAVPFEAPQRQQTQARFQVNGIPHLKIFSPFGQLVDDNAVQSRNLTVENIAAWEKGQQGSCCAPAMAHGGGGGGGGGCCGGGCH